MIGNRIDLTEDEIFGRPEYFDLITGDTRGNRVNTNMTKRILDLESFLMYQDLYFSDVMITLCVSDMVHLRDCKNKSVVCLTDLIKLDDETLDDRLLDDIRMESALELNASPTGLQNRTTANDSSASYHFTTSTSTTITSSILNGTFSMPVLKKIIKHARAFWLLDEWLDVYDRYHEKVPTYDVAFESMRNRDVGRILDVFDLDIDDPVTEILINIGNESFTLSDTINVQSITEVNRNGRVYNPEAISQITVTYSSGGNYSASSTTTIQLDTVYTEADLNSNPFA